MTNEIWSLVILLNIESILKIVFKKSPAHRTLEGIYENFTA